mgnify:FL=1
MISELYRYKNLINELVNRDIKKKYRRSILGILWSMLNPLLMMLITAMVFSNLFRFEIKNFALYLLTGQIIFTFYAEATNFAMGSILENGHLIKKVYVPKYLFPLSRVASSAVNLLFTLPAMFAIILITGQTISLKIIFCIIPLVLLFIFCLGVGLFLSALAVYFRDMFHLYGVALTALNYATPIFYPENIIPVQYQWLVHCNPIYYYLKMFREVVYSNQIPDINLIIICLFISIIALIVGIYFFNKKQNNFILYI